MLKCCGRQTNFILLLGGSFLFSKKFYCPPSLTGVLVMPIRRTKKMAPTIHMIGTKIVYINLFMLLTYDPLISIKQ